MYVELFCRYPVWKQSPKTYFFRKKVFFRLRPDLWNKILKSAYLPLQSMWGRPKRHNSIIQRK